VTFDVVSRAAIAMIVLGVVIFGLGVLWVLQGANAVHVRPILCVSACKPVSGRSGGWFIAGLISVVIGGAMIVAGARRTHRG